MMLIIYSISLTSFEDVSSACRSDGSFNPFLYEYSVWTASGYFEISVGFGNYSFSEVKVIDIFWDIVSIPSVVRTVQMLTYRLFRLLVV